MELASATDASRSLFTVHSGFSQLVAGWPFSENVTGLGGSHFGMTVLFDDSSKTPQSIYINTRKVLSGIAWFKPCAELLHEKNMSK